MAVVQGHMTADELLNLPDDGCRHELVAGALTTMSPAGAEHGQFGANVVASLHTYVRAEKLGTVFNSDTGFVLSRDPDTVRAPDGAFVSRVRIRAAGRVKGYWPGVPDLAIEVISPGDLYSEVDEKVAEWLASGTQMVVVLNPRRRTADIHRPATPVRILSGADVLDGEDVVPGWLMSLADVFRDDLPDE
jgi:Uma2 family endonuclease